ncbi:GerAB/ArcD/ProY family transporter [[Brevibacterium] frigoritolerans]|uniref:GerAB/ArcD/ProY family transporter n=1 Tax=Peribacillus frigoritolerans TaxID=450367 RepID=A0A941J7J2_9BACI|nr:GerAB/ArcD/ProY family transporter [Peribacillus frigoritolerans]
MKIWVLCLIIPFEIMKACKKMTLNYLGFELILIYYPFIKNREKSQKWAHLGALFTMVVYVVSILVSLAYYHQEQLKDVIWATLTLWKIVDLPFIERFEYIGISVWLFMVLPNVCLGVWAASRTAKRVFGFRQKKDDGSHPDHHLGFLHFLITAIGSISLTRSVRKLVFISFICIFLSYSYGSRWSIKSGA